MIGICEDLRKSVLQAAIQGRLTQQLPEDGDAETLYAEIQKEKQKLIKEGKIKKEKPLPEITDDDIPFDIPDNWKWVRIGSVSQLIGGYAYKSQEYVSYSENQLIRLGNVKQGKLLINVKQVFIPDEIASITEDFRIKANDILVTMTGTLRKEDYFYCTLVTDKDLEGMKLYLNQRVGRFIFTMIEPRFALLVLHNEQLRHDIFEWETGTANQGNLGSENIKLHFLFPLPPLSEQKRIVARVDELMKRIDEMEKTEKDITALYDAFPGDMKASLLQAAIQGKLTEQLASDGDAEMLYADIQNEKQRLIKEGKIKKEKPLPEITEDDIPFDIPENWKWVRQAEVCRIYTGNSIPEHIKLEKYMKSGIEGYNYIGTKDVSFDHVIDYENGVCIPYSEQRFKLAPEGSSLICIEGGSAGKKVGFLSQTVCFGNKLCMFNPYLIDQKYIYYWLQSPAFLESFFERMNGIIGGVKINALSTQTPCELRQ